MTDRQLYQPLERAVLALERIAGIETPAAKAPKPPLTEAQRKDLVTVVHRGETVPEWTGGIPPGGGHIHPTDFFQGADPHAGRTRRKTRSERGD